MPIPHITLVVACAKNRVIGRDGGMPWHLPADLKHFKDLTLGKPVVMGRRTFESIGKPLPGRQNIVVTRNRALATAGVQVVVSLNAALELADGDEVMVIGGARLYAEALPRAMRIHLTEIDAEIAGDTYFPGLDSAAWTVTAREHRAPDDRNPYPLAFITLEKI